ncbi:MAG: immunogenic protein [Sneathiella sp.]|uniref:TAXI family TRAP transporter solute-binding subunit n=1 Tax=Sneathiella sp. TaxID=1964365 RepID=UPI000C453437|nr:TAXI family TRAP transporter solute-binding subunit [Sneathiella sp.]MAZ04367.1 immunogenic protein [Sneathiella sp.]
MRIRFSLILAGFLALALSPLGGAGAAAEETRLFRIGTGGVGGTYYPVGQGVAHAITNPTGKENCAPMPCGVAHLLAVAQTANGSVSNLEDIREGRIESGFSQSDVAYWAHMASGIYKDAEPFADIRAIASLYREDIHLVARKGSGIENINDLRGRHVSLDDPGSGTIVAARIILKAYGLQEGELKAQYIKPADAIKKMRAGELDAFFVVAGTPSKAISELNADGLVTLIPIDGPVAARLTKDNAFFSRTAIPADSYDGIDQVRTLGVAALWVVHKNQSEEMVYEITRKFWENLPSVRKLGIHPKLNTINLKSAFASMSVPLHPGARRYYDEVLPAVAATLNATQNPN